MIYSIDVLPLGWRAAKSSITAGKCPEYLLGLVMTGADSALPKV